MVPWAKRFALFVVTNPLPNSCWADPQCACPLLTCQGVQLLLDGVLDYLPNPLEVPNYALDTAKDEEKVVIVAGISAKFKVLIVYLRYGEHVVSARTVSRIACRPSSSYRLLSSAALNLRLWLWLSSWKKESSGSSHTCGFTRYDCTW